MLLYTLYSFIRTLMYYTLKVSASTWYITRFVSVHSLKHIWMKRSTLSEIKLAPGYICSSVLRIPLPLHYITCTDLKVISTYTDVLRDAEIKPQPDHFQHRIVLEIHLHHFFSLGWNDQCVAWEDLEWWHHVSIEICMDYNCLYLPAIFLITDSVADLNFFTSASDLRCRLTLVIS